MSEIDPTVIPTTCVLTKTVAPHSVELAVNAKGAVQPTVKVYGDDPQAAAATAAAVLEALRIQLTASGLWPVEKTPAAPAAGKGGTK